MFRIHTDVEKFKDEAELCAADSVRLFDDELSQGRSSGMSVIKNIF